MCSRVFKTVFSYRFSYNLYWHFLGLFWPLLHSHGLNWHSQGPFQASRPLQSTCTVLACKRQFTRTFSRLWACCWGRESVVYSRSLFGLPYKGTLTAFISTLLASTDTFLASTTLTRPYFDTYGPLQTLSLLCNCLKASSGTLTIQALSLCVQALL